MHTSKPFYAIYVKYGKSHNDCTTSEETLIAERNARREILKMTRNLPEIRKQYKTKAEAEAAITQMNIGDDVRQWLEASETIAIHGLF